MVIENFGQKNQYIIEYENKIIFQSYDTIMFTYDAVEKTIYFNTDQDNYTQTTCKYLGMALIYLHNTVISCYANSKLCDLIESKNRKRNILSLENGVLELYD